MKKNIYILCALLVIFVFPLAVDAATNGTVMSDQVANYKAKVVSILKDATEVVPGTGLQDNYQDIEFQFLDGPKAGQQITLKEDYVKLEQGDIVYITDTIFGDSGNEQYSVAEPYRIPTLLLFTVIFIIVVLLIGGLQGLRGLLSLAGSFLLIIYVLLPGILHGYSPVAISILVSSLIIIVGSYITHGFNKTTSSAVVGMIITVIITGLLAFWAVHMGRFTGYDSEDASYLNLNSGGTINIAGILLGGIMIGLLGVLYDVAIGQAIAVEELHHIAPHIERKKIFTRALRIGREHIGALVNTLAIAYVGASLPLLLLFSQTVSSSYPVVFTLNREIFADQIIRTLIGSIGLVLAVPIVTLLAVWILVKNQKNSLSPEKLEEERKEFEHFKHHH